ncbi:MAG: RluA family pseudouridine synthase [Flavobacteriales bacterium]|nr:RluA family pseudouridine synthase [Flavobacteriales bacterium]
MSSTDRPSDPDSLEEQEDLYEHHRFVADPGQEALRIDRFLMDRVPNTSRTKLQAAALNGHIKVNDQMVKPNYKVRPGDDISIVLPYPVREIELIAEDIPLEIIYEDDDLVVIDKQAGMVVHPGYGNYTGTLVNALMFHFGELPSAEGSPEPRPGLVHRLDKNTSGAMVVAKTEEALTHLAGQFYDRSSDRRYTALAWGDLDEDGTITGNIGRSLKNRKVMDVFPDGEYGKHAVTHYKVLERLGYVTVVECKLETGRTHQIRAHMKHIGHPLFGDHEYGGDKLLKGTSFTKYKQFVDNCFKMLPRQALHARTLAITHPRSGERLEFESPLPEDMKSVIDKWRNYIASR